eukprot:SAG11_NODE_13877_length_635_cov_0.861940_1_plen_148_part_10
MQARYPSQGDKTVLADSDLVDYLIHASTADEHFPESHLDNGLIQSAHEHIGDFEEPPNFDFELQSGNPRRAGAEANALDRSLSTDEILDLIAAPAITPFARAPGSDGHQGVPSTGRSQEQLACAQAEAQKWKAVATRLQIVNEDQELE